MNKRFPFLLRYEVARTVYYVALLAGLGFVHLRLIDYAYDDAYIHVRIANHLLMDGQPYFNSDEAVMASSSQVWTLVLAIMLWLTRAELHAIAFANVLFTTLCVWVYGALIRRSSGVTSASLRVDLIAGVVLVPLLVQASIGLMETPLAMLVTGLAMLMIQARRPTAFVLFGLAVFIRVELAVVLAVFGVSAIARRISPPRVLVYAAAGALPFVAYAFYFFGTVVPHAVRAKGLVYSLTFGETVSRLVPLASQADATLIMMALPGTLMVGTYLVFRHQRDWVATAAYVSGMTIIVVYVARGVFVFGWYVPLYAVLLSWPILAVLLAPNPGRSRAWPRRATCVAALVVLVVPAQIGLVRYLQGAIVNPAYAPSFAQGARVQQYIAVGRRLFAEFPQATVLTSEVGGLGYGFPGKIDDAFGLLSPAALEFHPMKVPEERREGGLGAIPPGYVNEVKPPLIVSYDIFAEALLRSDLIREYVREYLPVFTTRDVALAESIGEPATLWGIQALHVLVRRDVYEQAQSQGREKSRREP